jgi:hypothetical protein
MAFAGFTFTDDDNPEVLLKILNDFRSGSLNVFSGIRVQRRLLRAGIRWVECRGDKVIATAVLFFKIGYAQALQDMVENNVAVAPVIDEEEESDPTVGVEEESPVGGNLGAVTTIPWREMKYLDKVKLARELGAIEGLNPKAAELDVILAEALDEQ